MPDSEKEAEGGEDQALSQEEIDNLAGGESDEPDEDVIIEKGEVGQSEGEEGEDGQDASAPLELEELGKPADAGSQSGIELLMDVDLEVKIELGRAQLPIEEILKLKKGAVVELDRLAGDPVDILVNERRVARGEILVVNDNFCVRVTEIVDPEAALKAGDEPDE
ncbi:MAG: flagellar motor switch protein FliN [Planctomycetota bacterium]|jgi:flagellar motor switch protein FliN/FliY